MHEKALPGRSVELLKRLEKVESPALRGWTLAGETGLALHLGHRASDDFDFFRTEGFDAAGLHDVFRSQGPYEVLQEAERTLTVISCRTKLSFFEIPDPFIYETRPYRFFRLADPRDIALMKLVAISGRGSRKDFVDLYCILRSGPSLGECFGALGKKYSAGRANTYHILKSLTYFADAEKEPPPRMLEPFDWEECKAYFVREAHAIVLG
jgi:hypothetical protein